MNRYLLTRFVKEAMLSANPQLAQSAMQFNDQLMRSQQEEQVADTDLMKIENPEFQVKNPVEDIDQLLHSAMPEIVEECMCNKKQASLFDQIVIENPRGSTKDFGKDYPIPTMTYPTDYGSLAGYTGEDEADLDFFKGTGDQHGSFQVWRPDVKGELETKFYHGLTPEERTNVLAAFQKVVRGTPVSYADESALQAAIARFANKPAQLLHSAMPEIVKDNAAAAQQNKTASAYVKDRPLKEVLKADDINRFAKGGKDVMVVQYGMVVKELVGKANPHNLAVARAHIKKEWDGRRLSMLKDEVYEQAKEKFILILNDRIIDGHHFLAKAEKAGLTSSINVIDLTPVRFQTKQAAAPTTVWGTLVNRYGHSHYSWKNPFEKRGAERVPAVRNQQRTR